MTLAPFPDVSISHHLPEEKQASLRHIPPRAAPQRCQAKGDASLPAAGADARPPGSRAPPRSSRWLCVPGGGAHAEKAACGRRARWAAAARAPGSAPHGVCAPSAAPWAPIAALRPGWGRGRQELRPLPSEASA